jgi:hypothetical protein
MPSKATYTPAAFQRDIASAAYLSDAGRKVALRAGSGPELLDLLEKSELTEDAIRFCARMFSKRAAVWWGCLCLWHVSRPQPAANLEAAVAASVRWTADPDEANRRAAGRAGEQAGFSTAAGCLAMAAFYTGGSMVDADAPVVPPPPDLAAETVDSAVLLAGGGPPASQALHRQFITLARGVASDALPWPPSSKSSPPASDDSVLADPTPKNLVATPKKVDASIGEIDFEDTE